VWQRGVWSVYTDGGVNVPAVLNDSRDDIVIRHLTTGAQQRLATGQTTTSRQTVITAAQLT